MWITIQITPSIFDFLRKILSSPVLVVEDVLANERSKDILARSQL
jgi:hypothetical protein